MRLRQVLGALLVLPMLFATPIGARAQEQPASPSPAATPPAPACKNPNVVPHVVSASQAETPPTAQASGLEGEVVVQVVLDATSHLLDAYIVASSSSILDASALKAARNSTYQTEIFNCRAIAAVYDFIVTYGYYPGQRTVAIPYIKFTVPVKYFPGTWICSADASSYTLTITQSSASDGSPTLDLESDGSAAQTLVVEHGLFWHYHSVDGMDLTAHAWYGNTWKFARDKSELDFTRVDDNTFVRTDIGLDDKGNQTKTNTRCVKTVATKV
jgi:TonB family protein